jgi:hypothetical protein
MIHPNAGAAYACHEGAGSAVNSGVFAISAI